LLKHKFKAIPTERDGYKFASKKEAKRYDELKLLQRANEVLFFLRQVPFHLPGGVKYLADFMIFWANGDCTVEDVKGFDIPSGKAKRKIAEQIYPIKIEVI